MKFGRKFEQSKIPEWADFYVSYKLLKKLLSPFNALKKVYLRSTINNNTISIHNFSQEEITQLDQFSKAFETIIFEDIEKVLMFYTQQLSQVIAKWKKIRINMMIFKERRDSLSKSAREQQSSMLKQAFQTLLRELKLMSDYITVNLEAFQKIIKKYHKGVKLFYPKDTLKIRLEKYLLETRIFIMRDRLNNFLSSVESEYINFFYKNKEEGITALRKITQGSLISKNETFWFGLFTGFAALLLLLIILLWVEEGHDVDADKALKEIFPMYRGMGIIVAYMGLLAWNVYGWTKYNVNYKLIFRFNHHYSQLSQILKRAAIFAAILLLLILWYLIIDADLGRISDGIDFIPKEILPLILWVIFAVYILFPSFKLFNGPGRRYMFWMIKQVLKTPFIPTTFIVIWATDQLTSFVLPLRDTEYTICYYISYFFYDDEAIVRCQSSKRFTKSVIMAIVPLVLRILQCLRQVYDNHHGRRDPLLNTGKYSVGLITSILSYCVSVYNSETRFVVAWIVFAAIGTIYSFCWDLKKDWDFLQPDAQYKFLRSQLSYRNPIFYYMALSGNLVMRLFWMFSISPDIIAEIMRPELFSFIVGLIEIFRRAVWNFLRVEKEHLANVGSFRAVQDLKLPYSDIVFHDKTQQDFFNVELEKIMHNNNKSEKPISVGSYLPYRTSLVSVAENYNRLDKPASKISLQFGNNEVTPRVVSAIPFQATAFASMNEQEKEQLLNDLQKYRHEQMSRSRRWMKEVENFKQLLKLRQSRFVVIDVDNEPLVFQDIDTRSGSPEKKKEPKSLRKGFKLNVIEENPEIYRTDLESSAHGKVELRLETPKATFETNESLLRTEEDAGDTPSNGLVSGLRKQDRIPTKVMKKVLGDVLSQEKSLWGQDTDVRDSQEIPSKKDLDDSTSFQTKGENTERSEQFEFCKKNPKRLSLNSVDDQNQNNNQNEYLAMESPHQTQPSGFHYKIDHDMLSVHTGRGSSDENNSPTPPKLENNQADAETTHEVVFPTKDVSIISLDTEGQGRKIHVKKSPRKGTPIAFAHDIENNLVNFNKKSPLKLSNNFKTSTGQSTSSD